MLKLLGLRSLLFAWAAVLTLVSCRTETTPATPDSAAVEPASTEAAPAEARAGESGNLAYAAIATVAVADPARPEDDSERDESRKPEAMLTFMEVRSTLGGCLRLTTVCQIPLS